MTVSVYNGKSALQLADEADDAVRGINHLTRDDTSLRYPAEVYRTLNSLTCMAERLPQALNQIATLLERWLQDGHIRIDGGDFHHDPVAAVTTASAYLLTDAATALDRLASALTEAQSAIVHASFEDHEITP